MASAAEIDELLPETPNPSTSESAIPVLTGRARALARAQTWKQKQRDKVDAERAELMFKRSFEFDETSEEYLRNEREWLARIAKLEEMRDSHTEVVEPTIEPDCVEFQSIQLPAVTVPLTIAIQDTFNSLRQRVGPSLDDWCPIETLYRFSSAQFLFFVDPVKYQRLSPVADFQNFDGIVRAIQLNAHYFNDDFEIVPTIQPFDPRCITIETIDRFRRMSTETLSLYGSVIDFDLNLLRSTTRDGKGNPSHRFDGPDVLSRHWMIPDDYTLDKLMEDAHSVRKLLTYICPSDSDFYRPRQLVESLLPPAPYLAIINQLPVRELARRVTSSILTFTYPSNSRLTFPLEPRIIGNDGYIYLMSPTTEEAEVLTAIVRSGDLPSGSHSLWDELDSDDDYGW